MIAKVNKAMKASAEKILKGDFSRSGFFLETDDSFESENEKREVLIKRARVFLRELNHNKGDKK